MRLTPGVLRASGGELAANAGGHETFVYLFVYELNVSLIAHTRRPGLSPAPRGSGWVLGLSPTLWGSGCPPLAALAGLGLSPTLWGSGCPPLAALVGLGLSLAALGPGCPSLRSARVAARRGRALSLIAAAYTGGGRCH